MTETVNEIESRPAQWAIVTYRVAGAVFAAAVTVQVFLAGLAIFTDPSRWAWHRTFSHAFELLPFVMLIVAFAGRLPARLRWASGALILLFFLQYATANSGGIIAAVHPVSAMVIFWLAVTSVRWSVHR